MSIITLSRGGLVARVDTKGAQLMGLALNDDEYLWQADPAWWAKTSPVLFPQVGEPGAKELQCSAGVCHMPRHGFARDFEHKVVAQDESSVTFELTQSEETLTVYPYNFTLNMTYAITGDATLTQTFKVTNNSDVAMPFAVGGHPAFNVPMPGTADESFDNYELRFCEPWTGDSPKIVDGGMISYADPIHILQDSDAIAVNRGLFDFDTVVLRSVPNNTIDLVSKVSGRGVRLDFPGFDFVGIWSAKPDAPFVAVEPWTGHAGMPDEDDVLEHRDNIIILAPGDVDERSFSMTVH